VSERTAKELSEELKRLLSEHLEHMGKRIFTGESEDEYQEEETRLRRIREVSADYLSALSRNHTDHD
jgi:hypothetical protein